MNKIILLTLIALAGCTPNMPTDLPSHKGVKPDGFLIKHGDGRKGDHYNGYSFRNKECIFGCAWENNDYYRLVFLEPGKGRPVMTHYAYAVQPLRTHNNSAVVIFKLKDKQRFVQSINHLYLRMNTCIEQYLEQNIKRQPMCFVEFINYDFYRVAAVIQPCMWGFMLDLPHYITLHNPFFLKLKKDEVAQYEQEHPEVIHMREDLVKISHREYKYVKKNNK
jgi:hypothetical protein